jgi:hypothetical protein
LRRHCQQQARSKFKRHFAITLFPLHKDTEAKAAMKGPREQRAAHIFAQS